MKKYIIRCVIALICGGIGAFIALSLITYTPTDPSVLFDSSTHTKITNGGTLFGASLAGMLLFWFGATAFLLIPLFFTVLCITLKVIAINKHMGRLMAFLGLFFIIPLIEQYFEIYLIPNVNPGGYIGYSSFVLLERLLAPPTFILFLGTSTLALFVLIDSFASVKLIRPFIMYISSYRIMVHIFKQPYISGIYVVDKIKQTLMNIYAYVGLEETSEAEDKLTCEVAQIFTDPFWIEPTLKDQAVTYNIPARNIPACNNEQQIQDVAMQKKPAYALPRTLFMHVVSNKTVQKKEQHREHDQAQLLEQKLALFGIAGTVTSITSGPVVTLFEYSPAPETKISTILAREHDLALALEALSLRIIAPIPGKSVVGFEVAHHNPEPVLFKQLIIEAQPHINRCSLPLLLGTDTQGKPVTADLVKLPHLLLAGTTGSGKSVAVQNMLMTLLCHKVPQELKIILIDPKRLELSIYQDIGHLLFPVITEPKQALFVLKWATEEMERRYTILTEAGVKNCVEYHALQASNACNMPFIVIIIDELADLMMTAGKDLEISLVRLAQMARAAGIHLITATQRPSVDIVTGLIKVNFPSRLACKVASKIDSRTILDAPGAEKLLGRGDMLFLNADGTLQRLHGAYVHSDEIEKVANAIRAQTRAQYEDMSLLNKHIEAVQIDGATQTKDDELFQKAVEFIKTRQEVSISLIQRVFKIGYNRSARIIEQLEENGYVMPQNGSKKRKVNVDSSQNLQ